MFVNLPTLGMVNLSNVKLINKNDWEDDHRIIFLDDDVLGTRITASDLEALKEFLTSCQMYFDLTGE